MTVTLMPGHSLMIFSREERNRVIQDSIKSLSPQLRTQSEDNDPARRVS